MTSVAERYDPFREPQLSDPYPLFSAARKSAPVFYADGIDHWVVSRYEDVRQVLRNYRDYSAQNTIMPIHPLCEAAQQALEEGEWNMIPALGNADRPAHTRTRMNVVKAFTPRRIAELEPYIRTLIERAIERVRERGEAELMKEFIFDLPALVILKLLGFPDEQAPAIKEGAKNRILFVWGRPSDEEQTELARGLAGFFKLCRGLVDERLRTPADDLSSELLRVRAGNDAIFSLDLIASILFAFFTAGHETTSSLIANAVRRLLEQRETWAHLCREPSSIANAIEEILRYDSSVIAWRRRARRRVNIAGAGIPEGAQLLLLLGSANHDESIFDSPGRLDIGRLNAEQHLSFGSGIHHCLGAGLARLEAKLVIEILSRRLPGLRLRENQRFDFLPNIVFRGPRELHVRWPTREQAGNAD